MIILMLTYFLDFLESLVCSHEPKPLHCYQFSPNAFQNSSKDFDTQTHTHTLSTKE